MKGFLILFLGGILAGCSLDGVKTEFSGEVAMDKKPSDYVALDEKGQYDQNIFIYNKGKEENPAARTLTLAPKEVFFAEGGGIVLRPIRVAWAVLHTKEALHLGGPARIESKDPTEPPFKELPPKEGYAFGFQISFVKPELLGMLRPNWIVQWLHKVTEGTVNDPEKISITYEKLDGIPQFKHWHGTIVLQKLDDNATAVAVKDTIYAIMDTSEANSEDSVRHVIQNMRTMTPNFSYLQKAAEQKKN